MGRPPSPPSLSLRGLGPPHHRVTSLTSESFAHNIITYPSQSHFLRIIFFMHAQSRPRPPGRSLRRRHSLPSLSCVAWRGVWLAVSLGEALAALCHDMTDSLLASLSLSSLDAVAATRRRPGRAGNGEGESRARRGGRGGGGRVYCRLSLRHPAVAMRRGRAAPAVMFPLLLLPVRACPYCTCALRRTSSYLFHFHVHTNS